MASLGSKRDWEVSEIDEAKGVSVHGIPMNVSPTKESRSTKGVFFFEAQLCDSKKSVRLVSFDVSHRAALKKAEDEKAVVALANANHKKEQLQRAVGSTSAQAFQSHGFFCEDEFGR